MRSSLYPLRVTITDTIMPLDVEHIDEICADIKNQYENGIATCALFCMTLVPEGNPPVNKAKIMSRQYDLFKEKLSEAGVPSGVLVQASIGHGRLLAAGFHSIKIIGNTTNKTIC